MSSPAAQLQAAVDAVLSDTSTDASDAAPKSKGDASKSFEQHARGRKRKKRKRTQPTDEHSPEGKQRKRKHKRHKHRDRSPSPDLAEVDFAKGLQTQIEYVQTRQTERVNADEWVAANAQQTADADGAAART